MRWTLLAGALVVVSPASAGDDQDLATKALQHDQVLPLAQLLPKIEASYDARLIGIEFHDTDRGYVYELELITPDGRMIEIPVDAATGAVVPEESGDPGDADNDRGQ